MTSGSGRIAVGLASLAVGLVVAGSTPALGDPSDDLRAFVHNSDLLVNPRSPNVLYASFWIYGVYKSEDFGKNWRAVNRGFKNSSVYALAMSARDPDLLFAGTHAGGMYRSVDGGERWVETNQGLTATTIWDLAVEPGNPERVYALTSAGLFRTTDRGAQWVLLPGGLPGSPPDQQMTLFAVSGPPFDLLLLNGGQLFRWQDGWSDPLLTDVTRIRASPLVVSPSGDLVVGTEKGFVRSPDRGRSWNPLGGSLRLPNWIAWVPGQAKAFVVGTDGFGVFKTSDGGATFEPRNTGLDGPTSQKVFGLAVDPTDGRRLYLASHSIGLYRSEDGGATWKRPERFPIPELSHVAAATKAAVVAGESRKVAGPPPVFLAACNRCHGWTHPALDSRTDVVWRAAPAPRDWSAIVERMGILAGLSESDRQIVSRYLNDNFGPSAQE